MPTYDYQCQKCDHLFEVFQSMNDAKLTECPQSDCDGVLKRLLGTGAGVIFKGSGFYETDFKDRSNYQSGKKKEQGAPTTPSSKDAPKDSSTKASTKSEPKASRKEN